MRSLVATWEFLVAACVISAGHQASSQGGHGKRRWWLLQSLIWKRFCSLFLLSRKHLLSGSIYWDTTRMTQLKISLIWKYNLASHVKRNKASDISIEPNISSQELKSSVLVLGHVSIRGLLFFKPCVMWPNWIIYNNFWEWTRQPGPSLKHNAEADSNQQLLCVSEWVVVI